MLTITIPTIAPSANAFYAGMHPMARRKLAQAWHAMVAGIVKIGRLRPFVAQYPIDIGVVCYFGKNRKIMDSDNLFPTAKLAIDGLVAAGIIPGDSPKYVRQVSFRADRSDNGKSYTNITLMEIPKEVHANA